MSDHETESFTPYEPQTSYDWDYGDEQPKNKNVLWGRLAALAGVLLITFFLGRASAPNGIPQEQFDELRAELNDAEGKIEELEVALQQPEPEPTETPVTVDGEGEDTTIDEGDYDLYVVQSGDTMRGIAETFCGDPTVDDVIADYNGIADPTILSVGTELKIPKDCGK